MQNSEQIDNEEKQVSEPSEITVIDESMPSPAEIQTDETIVLLEIVSMPDYIRRHYEKDLIRTCIHQMNDLTLCVMYEGRLFHDVPGLGAIDSNEEEMLLTDGPTPLEWGEPQPFSFDRNVYSATIRPIDGTITRMDFYRLSDCCVEAELTIEIQMYFRYGSSGKFKKIAQKYYVTAWFEMEGGIAAEFGDFTLHRPHRNKDIVKLDEYLVPVFKWDDIEEESENIIFDIVSEGLTDPKKIQPGLFAERMGLKIVHLPLYKRPRTSSILLMGAIAFTVTQYSLPPEERKYLVIRDENSKLIELWIAAIESAFSLRMAAGLSFATRLDKFANANKYTVNLSGQYQTQINLQSPNQKLRFRAMMKFF